VTDKLDYELLIELSKLLKKYHPELSKSLAENLSSPEFIERLVSVLYPAAKIPQTSIAQENKPEAGKQSLKNSRSSLRKGAKTGRKKNYQSTSGNRTQKSSHPSFLVNLEKTEPEKAVLLIKFYDKLMDKTCLPTLANIRTFASKIGVQPIKSTSRSKAILPLVKALLPLSLEELKTKLDTVMPGLTQDDRSLEGWANIILDKEHRSK
jgi:hypothetical protein